MYPAKFEYVAPNSLQEAVGLLEDPEAKVLAGGHSLLPLMKLRLAQPKLLVDIGRIPGLNYIRVEGDQLAIGALTTYRDLQLSEDVHRRAPALAEAAQEVGDPQVRARGTLAGALAHADPAGDMPAVVLAMGGGVRTVGPQGERAGERAARPDLRVAHLVGGLGDNGRALVDLLRQLQVAVGRQCADC